MEIIGHFGKLPVLVEVDDTANDRSWLPWPDKREVGTTLAIRRTVIRPLEFAAAGVCFVGLQGRAIRGDNHQSAGI